LRVFPSALGGREAGDEQGVTARGASVLRPQCGIGDLAARSGAMLQRPYASAAHARRPAAARRPTSVRVGRIAPRLWSQRPLRSVHTRWKRPTWVPRGTVATTHDTT
jgi:hypothetical protein